MGKKYEIAHAKHGHGFFALQPFLIGDYICEYTGEKIRTLEADKRKDNRYLFELDADWTIDGSCEANDARYINHSCSPNAEATIEGGCIVIRAAKSIQKGEEVTIDYGEEYMEDFLKNACGCDADVCRSPQKVTVV